MTRKSNGSIVFSLLAALMAVFLMAAPALAGGGKGGEAKASSDHDGDADNDSGTAYTEDDDTNDGEANNVEDDDDNAHPSGKDRSTENGGSGNQGNSESDPDDDGRGPDRSNGGPDKPNGSGGVDLADQDGNNGCGNDDDFEDDNEGWCGKPPKDDEDDVEADEVCKDHWMESNSKKCDKPDDVCEKNENMPAGHEKDCDEDEVEGDKVCEEDETMPAGHEDECDEVEGSETGKVTICHATGSMTNPFVVITVSENGLNGHGDHEGDIVNPAGECVAPGDVEGSDLAPCEGDMVEAGSEDEPCEVPSLDGDTGLPGDEVLGGSLGQPTGEEGPEVLGAGVEAGEDGGALPFTGGAVLPFLLVAGALIGAGVFLYRRDRTEQI